MRAADRFTDMLGCPRSRGVEVRVVRLVGVLGDMLPWS